MRVRRFGEEICPDTSISLEVYGDVYEVNTCLREFVGELYKMKQYDRSATQTQFQVGDKVFVYISRTTKGLSRKPTSHWLRPSYIVKLTGPVTFKVKSVRNNIHFRAYFHANRV